ncbi:MAG: DNA repair protein RecN [Acidimicrobiia bacterium]
MLEEVTARNLGLIERAVIAPSPRLTVITGETGTGKTLMLGALRLLRGEKAAKDLIGPAAEFCEVSARSRSGSSEVIVRRRMDANRSRAYVDDAATTATALGALMSDEIAIVGQHDQHTITSSTGVRSIVDHHLSSDGQKARDDYAAAWDSYQEIIAQREAIGSDPRSLEREHSMVAFQVEEIDAADLSESDDAMLKQRAIRLRNAEGLASEVGSAVDAFGDEALGASLSVAAAAVSRASLIDPDLQTIKTGIDDLAEAADRISGDLAIYATGLDVDPAELAAVEERLALISALKRKYGDTVEDILIFRKDAAARREELAALLSTAEGIDERTREAIQTVTEAGHRLAAERELAGAIIAEGAIAHLTDLGFSQPDVEVEVVSGEPSQTGTDRIRVMFASDTSLPLAPVASVASGGELSRLVLALILASGTADAAVVAFDEIDAGIGGVTALAMGEKLASLAEQRQVICVTHLPQVAAFGDLHLAVERSGSTTTVRTVTDSERVEELSRMLAGLSDSEKGQEHAAELLEIASQT